VPSKINVEMPVDPWQGRRRAYPKSRVATASLARMSA
jgi:hypothetical protein